jgi:hypothetical protein
MRRKKELGKVTRKKIPENLSQPLFFLDNYLKGAAYRFGGANCLA